jgi:hypothetical protein
MPIRCWKKSQKLGKSMSNSLLEARRFSRRVRFSGDTLEAGSIGVLNDSNSIKSFFYCNELAISHEVTPDLYKSLTAVLSRLNLDLGCVEGFVYASPDINASCHAYDEDKCVMRFSSTLVDLLSRKEFEFVVGHELGHFLLEHSFARMSAEDEGIDFYIKQRAQELSADRIGLISCDSLDVAVKALLKTVSGLNETHLRFNVGAFLSQLRKVSSIQGQQQSTHPSILVRCRALLWFSLGDFDRISSGVFDEEELESLDARIQKDLDKYVDSSIRARIEECTKNLKMWMAAHEISQDGVFSKAEQEKFSKLFGKDTLDSVARFMKGIPASDLEDTIYGKVRSARSELEALVPTSFEEIVSGFNGGS